MSRGVLVEQIVVRAQIISYVWNGYVVIVPQGTYAIPVACVLISQ